MDGWMDGPSKLKQTANSPKEVRLSSISNDNNPLVATNYHIIVVVIVV